MSPANFTVLDEIYRGRTRVVYRGRFGSADLPILVKTMSRTAGAATGAASLIREHEILHELQIDGVARTLGLVPHQGSMALLLEDAGGERLKSRIERGRVDLGACLEIGVQLTAIVAAIHERNVIHKDINPNNILVDPETSRVTLIDFSISSRLPAERRRLGHPSVLEGTIAYMSPEQTGRMNRDIDYRTDFYSLGVTLYEMLTGKLPFDSADPLEVVHYHIAKTPPAPSDLVPDIPRPVSAIVMKLLAKTAEERYQSALGVQADLASALQEWRATGRITRIDIGREDLSERFVIPQRLYGRETEIAALQAALERACQGPVELLLVAGYSGIGKTSLIHEVHRSLSQRRGHFVSGKFDQLLRNVPYGAFAQAFRGLVRQILTESEAVIQAYRDRFLEALGANAQVVIDVIPELALIVGEQPEVPALGAAESRNRFHLLFQRFMGVCATAEHPLVLFLDDLQWADSASLDLLRTFMTSRERGYLLIFGAYRDNEVNPAHPLVQTLAEIRQSNARVSEIGLGPLALDDLVQFVADTLHTGARQARPLGELVQKKTEGNPFFVTQFLKSAHQDGHIRLARAARRWDFDLEAIRAMDMTANVVELMASRIQKLAPPTQEVLKLAACVGNRFDLATLATVHDRPVNTTATDLWEAIECGLVVPLEESIDTPAAAEAELVATYKFLHDRVQQAAYALIPTAARRQAHLALGRLLLAHTPEADLDARVFDIVHHLDYGIDLLDDPAERARLARLNFTAGRKAKLSTAYSAALDYFTTAARLLGGDAWESAYEFAFQLHLEIAECRYLCGRFEAAEESFAELLRRARTRLDAAAVHTLRVIQYENQSRYVDAVAAGREGLALLGIDLPAAEREKEAAFQRENAAIDARLQGRTIAGLADLQVMTDPEIKMRMRLLMTTWAPAYIAADNGLIALLPALMVHLSLEYGNATESACGYVIHAISVGTRLGDYARGHEFGLLALAVNDRFHDLQSRAKVQELFSCFVNLWCRPLRSCLAHAREAYRAGLESGDLAYACYGCYVESWYGLLTSSDLNAFQRDYVPNTLFLAGIKMQSFATLQQVILHWGLCFQGRTDRPGSLDSPAFDAAKFRSDYHGIAFFETFYYIVELMVRHAFDEHSAAREAADSAARVVHALAGTIWPALLAFHQALVIAELHADADAASQTRDLELLDTLAARLAVWERSCPENFAHMSKLVAAERARITGDTAAAIELYEAALAAAAASDMPGQHALAQEIYGKFWLRRGQHDIAALFLMKAREIYAAWGAAGKVAHLERRYPGLLGPASPARRTAAKNGTPSSTLVTTYTDDGSLDFFSVVKASQAISDEIFIDKLLANLMGIVIQNAGAQRGVLILEREGQPLIQAEGSLDPGAVRVLHAVPLAESRDIAAAAVNLVRRTRESLVVIDALEDPAWASDAYVRERRPRSILCVPVLHQGVLTGVLYLENNLTAGAFTPDRIQVMQVLTSQAAIAIRNAELYAEVTRLRDRLQAENVYLQEEIKTRTGFEDIVGKSPALQKVLQQVEQVAPTDTTVLVLGETGTGKELIARAIHALSRRKERPLVTVNCGAISPGLVESELFGHEKGAFTGALSRKIGRFELADGGTIFLDEIGDLQQDLQVKLLRVLQEGDIERLGGTRTIRVDVRVIAATHRDLAKRVAEGAFREDLYYRLNVFPIHSPALRDRKQDIPLLVRHFVLQFAAKLGRTIESIPQATLDALLAYSWPGNIRELRNIVERSVIVSQGTALELGDWIAPERAATAETAPVRLENVERDHVQRVLQICNWRVSGRGGAAEMLGLKPTTLEARMKKLGIRRPR